MVSERVSLKLETEIFFAKDKMAPEVNHLILRILEHVISSKKNNNKQTKTKGTIVCLKVYRKTKIPRPSTKEDKSLFLHLEATRR